MMGGLLALTSCGGSDNDGAPGGGNGSGTITEQWAGFCTATFTADTPIIDAFDEPIFTARAGDEFLLSDFSDSFGGRAELVYLTSAGPDSFEVKPSSDGSWPFTSNCTINQGVPYYAAFENVSVFAEKELTTKICDISEGTVLPAGTTGRGYAFAGSLGASALYEVILGPFSTQCQGMAQGYVSVPQTRSFGSTTWLVPIAGIIGPE
jgi:hypothetical protein